MINRPTLRIATLFLSISMSAFQMAAQDADALAKQLANPVSTLISVPVQENLDFGYANNGWKSTTNFQPVIPVSISEDWNFISRTIVPFNYAEDVVRPGSAMGFGDILQSTFFSPKEPTSNGWIWGVGPVASLPTGDDDFTIDEWLLGPTAVFLKQKNGWTYGALVNHIWDVSSSTDVSATFIQPFLTYGSGGGVTSGQTLERATGLTRSSPMMPQALSVST